MAEDRLPLLRGRITAVDTYQTPARPRVPPLDMSAFDVKVHQERLLAQLTGISQQVKARELVPRDELASRELIVVHPAPGMQLMAEQLDDTKADSRLVGMVAETGVVLLDVASADLQYLREKIDAFADESKVVSKEGPDGTTKRSRAHERAIAPIAAIGLSSLEDIATGLLRNDAAILDRPHWLEIACRGGYRNPPTDERTSRAQICQQLHRMQLLDKELPEFRGPEQIYFFVRLGRQQLWALLQATDCIYEVALAPPPLRDLQLLEDDRSLDLKGFALTRPPADAPSVVVLDTGIASEHPMLKEAILSATFASPEIPSAEDTYGHGTKMAGISLHRDLGAAIERGASRAPHWLQSSRLLITPGHGIGADEHHEIWPVLTEKAVRAAEEADPSSRNRAFVLAVTRTMQDPPLEGFAPTLWSHAIDKLAFGEGRSRLMIVSAGNARESQWLTLAQDHPQLQLSEKIHQPAQAANALTIGAFTARVELPPSEIYREARVVATVPDGMSPFTSTGLVGNEWPIKPDVVLEGGNLAVSGLFSDPDVPTLNALTTSHRHTSGRPLGMLAMTSEASARAAHLAARIWALEPTLRPETVRGLIVHSASWTSEMETQFGGINDRLLAYGYGVPDEVLATGCAQGIATILIEDAIPNTVVEEEPKKEKPKRATTKSTELKSHRKMKIYRLPVPHELLGDSDPDGELRVTLSYFAEPKNFSRSTFHGLDLKWDMQGPQETEDEFLQRINVLKRPKGLDGKPVKGNAGKSFKWEVGIQRRSRGTVQSDRWRGKMSSLVGDKLIAIVPVSGWWDQRQALKEQEMRFSLIVSVLGPGVYSAIKPRVEEQALVPVEV